MLVKKVKTTMSKFNEYLENFIEDSSEEFLKRILKEEDYDAKLRLIWGWIKQEKMSFKEFKYIMEKGI